MQRETEMLLDSVIRENRGVMELLTADYTFLNERLAQHYDIADIQGSHFRRVQLPADSPRRGLLGHGSILTRHLAGDSHLAGHPRQVDPEQHPRHAAARSAAERAGALDDRRTQAKVKTVRERMAQHRANPACATCHSMIDPTGFALENFDAIGRWRTVDESYNPIDASGQLPDGSSFNGVQGLRASLAAHPERFAHTVTEKLMTYALGRGVEAYDMPAMRKILRDAAASGYKMQDADSGHREELSVPVPRAWLRRRRSGAGSR